MVFNMRFIKTLVMVFLIGLGIWLFYWPILEGIYASSWTPIQDKAWSVISGLFIVIVGFRFGYKAVI